MESFRKLGLSEQLLRLLEKEGFSEPSEIQEKVIPLVLQGKDVIGGSATGSGKTLAFGTGIIEKTEHNKGLQVLILTPTRELAEQVGTIFGDIEHIAKKHMKNPRTISVESYVDPAKLRQIYYDVPKNLKFSLLVHLLKRESHKLVMVFCNTRHNTDFIGRNLGNLGIDVLAIHGGLTQQKRNKIMEKFSDNKVHVLVCTDIAARGLDIKGISHIYNYDIPKTSKDYIHRIGRTARAGKEGIAINILSDRDYDNFGNVLKDPSLNIEKAETPEIETVRMMLPNQNMQRRQRGDSEDWRSRKCHREPHVRNREGSGEGQREERPGFGGHRGPDRGNFRAGQKNFGGRGGRGNFGSRRRIPQRSGNYRSQKGRQGNRARNFNRRRRF